MGKYILKRLLWMIPVVLGVAIFIFTIMYFVPGNPAELILGTDATPEALEKLEHEMGLDQPYYVQLLRYLKQVFLEFDFGNSYYTKRSVSAELIARLPRTVAVGLSAMVLTILIGTPLGITAAVHQNGPADRFCMVVALLGVSLPTFWLALMLVILFSLKLHLLPSTGIGSFKHYIIPVLAQSVGGWGGQARLSRSSMLEELRSDYVTTARAKGLTKTEVTYKHALPNALIPIITSAGMSLANIFGGSVVIENVFSIPGVGNYMIQAINTRDYPIIEGSVIFLALIFAICMLLVDLAYAFVDPRIKARYTSQSKKRKGRTRI